jgi:TIGR03009 family protein
MRFAGITLAALLVAATAALAQPPVPGAPPAPPPPAPKAADPNLDAHLVGWERKMADVKNLRTEIALKRTDAVFKKDTNYTGVVLCMKPTFAVLRLDNSGDPTKTDYEAYICDGKALYAYNGVQKTVTRFTLPQNQQGVDNLMIDFLSGMKAKDVKERFDINLFKTDEHYIYLDIKPLRPADQREFAHLRLALYGPTTKFAYLPAQVYMLKPSGDSELWKFTNPQIDIPGVDAKAFQYVEIKEKGWKVQDAPPTAAGGPVPAGGPPGAVRPTPKQP